jgi:hypothetical protein
MRLSQDHVVARLDGELQMTNPQDLSDPPFDERAPRVESVIDACMKRFPGVTKAAQARYFEAVHQDLAPLARELERTCAEQAARIQQLALNYITLFDQCSEALAKVAALEAQLAEAKHGVARVEETPVGPKLFVNDVLVHSWFGCCYDENVKAIAASINAAHPPAAAASDMAKKHESATISGPHSHDVDTSRAAAASEEPQPSLGSPLTPYGMLVRALRIVAGTTLMDMAKHLGRGSAELSSIELGRKPVRDADIVDAAHFFACAGIHSTTHALTMAARAAEQEKGKT